MMRRNKNSYSSEMIDDEAPSGEEIVLQSPTVGGALIMLSEYSLVIAPTVMLLMVIYLYKLRI